MIKAIVCMDRGCNIGKDGKMLYHLPIDLKYFQNKTTGHFIAMGRRTFESFKNGPLKNRVNIVLSSCEHYKNCINIHDMLDFRETIKEIGKNHTVFIIGGMQTYLSTIDLCDEVLVTKVLDAEATDADSKFFDMDNLKGWELTNESSVIEDNGHLIQFCTYKHCII